MSSNESKPLILANQPGNAPTLTDSNFIRSGYHGALPQADGAGPPSVTGGPTFSGLARAFRRRWLLALGAGCVAAAAVVALVLTLMPLGYRATTTFYIRSRSDATLEGPREDVDFAIVKSNQAALVKSSIILRNALDQKTESGQAVKDLSIVRSRPDPVAWLEGALKVDFPSGEIMRVSLSAERPDEVAELLNAIAKALVEENKLRENKGRDERIVQLKEGKRDREEELRVKQGQLDKLLRTPAEKEREGAKKLDEKAQQTLFDNQTKLEVGRGRLRGLKAKLTTIATLPAPLDRLDEILKSDPRAAGIFTDLAKVQSDINLTKNNGTEAVARVEVARLEKVRTSYLAQLAALRESLLPELEARYRMTEGAKLQALIFDQEQDIEVLDQLNETLKLEIARLQKIVHQPVPPELKNLQNNIASIEKVRNEIVEKIAKMESESPRLRIVHDSPAAPPTGKDASRQIKFAGAGGFGLFCLALLGVAYFEFRSRKIGEADDLGSTGLNVVGTIPSIPARVRQAPPGGSPTPKDIYWQNQLSESIDTIRTLLLHVSRTDSLRVLMVTSATGGEGKTSLASQLAASLARAWRKTLLIDGDLRHPASHSLFGLPLEPGFSEVLRGEVNPADAIKPTQLSRLWMMPAGHWDAHAVQALAQENVRGMLEQLKQQYDFIIIDSCPVLPVADSLVLGQHVDGVVFSVLRDVSRLPALQAAHQKMSSLGIRTLGAVVIGGATDGGGAAYKYAAVGGDAP